MIDSGWRMARGLKMARCGSMSVTSSPSKTKPGRRCSAVRMSWRAARRSTWTRAAARMSASRSSVTLPRPGASAPPRPRAGQERRDGGGAQPPIKRDRSGSRHGDLVDWTSRRPRRTPTRAGASCAPTRPRRGCAPSGARRSTSTPGTTTWRGRRRRGSGSSGRPAGCRTPMKGLTGTTGPFAPRSPTDTPARARAPGRCARARPMRGAIPVIPLRPVLRGSPPAPAP